MTFEVVKGPMMVETIKYDESTVVITNIPMRQKSVRPDQGRNDEPPDYVMDEIAVFIERAAEETAQPPAYETENVPSRAFPALSRPPSYSGL